MSPISASTVSRSSSHFCMRCDRTFRSCPSFSASAILTCRAVGSALAAVIEEAPTPPLLIASTDLTHCGPGFGQSPPPGLTAEAFAHQQDRLAIEAIYTLDGERLHQTVETHQVTMCGYVSTTTVLFAARTLGARQAQLVRYATSADVSGDVHRVVGYAGLIML